MKFLVFVLSLILTCSQTLSLHLISVANIPCQQNNINNNNNCLELFYSQGNQFTSGSKKLCGAVMSVDEMGQVKIGEALCKDFYNGNKNNLVEKKWSKWEGLVHPF